MAFPVHLYFVFRHQSQGNILCASWYIIQFTNTPPSLWLSNSPDLNPVDYKIWGLFQQRVYSRRIQNVDELRQRIVEEWARQDQRVIDNTVNVASTTSLLCGCEGRTFRANDIMCQSDSIFSIAWQLWSFIFVKCDTIFKDFYGLILIICCTSQ